MSEPKDIIEHLRELWLHGEDECAVRDAAVAKTGEAVKTCTCTAISNPTCPAHTNPVAHPLHYTQHPSGIECIQVTEHFGFCIGNAIKYLWRADLKGGIEDLKKAAWYIEREIARREREGK